MMNYNNSNRAIYTPIVLALVLIIGIFIGKTLIPTQNYTYGSSSTKVGALLGLIEENYVDKFTSDSLQEIAIPKILDVLDPHTIYIPAKDLEEINAPLVGNFEGIGVQFNIQDDTLLIVTTISGGPSEKIGILAGDRIVTINDSLFAGIGITNEDVVKNLKGKKGTSVKLGIKRRGIRDLIYFDVVRDEIPLYSVDVSYMLTDDIGYVKISKFSATTHAEFVEAAKKLFSKGMKKMVLDLRQNGGGYLKAAADIADEFLPKGKMIVYTKDRYENKSSYVATKMGICENIELEILIDVMSASASEIVAGAIQDNDRGTIIGRRSFGKGLVQEPFEFYDGSAIRLTIARYYTPVGRCIQKSYANGREAYEETFFHRLYDGDPKDTTQFPDSLKYTTPQGKVVYGGGGITPDIYVAVDTMGYSKGFTAIVSKGLIYKYALIYTDNHRKELTRLADYKQINRFLIQKNAYHDFMKYVKGKGVKINFADMKTSERYISARLRAYIARNIINDDGYYPIIREVDNVLEKSVKSFQKK